MQQRLGFLGCTPEPSYLSASRRQRCLNKQHRKQETNPLVLWSLFGGGGFRQELPHRLTLKTKRQQALVVAKAKAFV